MSQYNKLSDIQYARFHILPVDLHFETVLVSRYPHHDDGGFPFNVYISLCDTTTVFVH